MAEGKHGLPLPKPERAEAALRKNRPDQETAEGVAHRCEEGKSFLSYHLTPSLTAVIEEAQQDEIRTGKRKPCRGSQRSKTSANELTSDI